MSHSRVKNAHKLQCLLDENVDVRVVSFLKKKGFLVEIVPGGLQNGEVASLAQKGSFIFLTNDKDFSNTDLYPPENFSGIIVFRVHPPDLINIQRALEMLFSLVKPKEFFGKSFVVGKEGVEIIG